jgi:hypothetical protein
VRGSPIETKEREDIREGVARGTWKPLAHRHETVRHRLRVQTRAEATHRPRAQKLRRLSCRSGWPLRPESASEVGNVDETQLEAEVVERADHRRGRKGLRLDDLV